MFLSKFKFGLFAILAAVYGLAIRQGRNSLSVNDLFQGDIDDSYPDSVMLGDIEDDSEIIGIGDPVVVTQSDSQKMAQGASLAQIINAKMARRVRPGQNNNVGKAAKIAIGASMATPNNALSAAHLPPVFQLTNAILKQAGTETPVSGTGIKNVFNRWSDDYPIQTTNRVIIATDGAAIGVEFGNAQLGAGQPNPSWTKIGVPVVFITIASSNNISRPGARYSVALEGVAASGGMLANDETHFERIDGNKPMTLILFPYIRVKEIMRPQMAIFGANGTDEVKLTVKIKGLAKDESVSVTVPGFDSSELKALCRTLNIVL